MAVSWPVSLTQDGILGAVAGLKSQERFSLMSSGEVVLTSQQTTWEGADWNLDRCSPLWASCSSPDFFPHLQTGQL